MRKQKLRVEVHKGGDRTRTQALNLRHSPMCRQVKGLLTLESTDYIQEEGAGHFWKRKGKRKEKGVRGRKGEKRRGEEERRERKSR